jgi:hypothetical protein
MTSKCGNLVLPLHGRTSSVQKGGLGLRAEKPGLLSIRPGMRRLETDILRMSFFWPDLHGIGSPRTNLMVTRTLFLVLYVAMLRLGL